MLSGDKIKMLRIQNCYSVKYIAAATGLSERMIQYIENDGVSCSEDTYKKIINAINGVIKPLPENMPKKTGRPRKENKK